MTDASFTDGAEKPVRLRAECPEDLAVISALVQDAIGQNAETSWQPKKHRFSLLINRFRWEDKDMAKAQGRPFERVQSTLVFESALKVGGEGLNPADKEQIFALLGLEFIPSEEGAGTLSLILQGDGAIRLEVECIDVALTDVSRPYVARAKHMPKHPVADE
ncbi:MAG: DUF2948 family protein [Rhodobacteraceae bacterium]|nr:DUF2948 family protein [Paracoccaceae bacterium]